MGSCTSRLDNMDLCEVLIPVTSSSTKWIKAMVQVLRQTNIELIASEVVVHISLASKHLGEGQSITTISATTADPSQLSEELRNTLLTPGSVHFCPQPGFLSRGWKSDMGISLSIRQIRGISFDVNRQVITILFESINPAQEEQQAIMYKSPVPQRLLSSLAQVIITSYAGTPEWAIPLKWKLKPISLSRIAPDMYKEALGNDSGFSSALHATLLGKYVEAFFGQPKFSIGPRAMIYNHIIQQQEKKNLPRPQLLDLKDLARVLPNWSENYVISKALECLPYNLVFRTLRINNVDRSHNNAEHQNAFDTSLMRVLHYNVTLCELDLSG